MSTIDTSTWNPDPDLNESIEGIPLNDDASISQTWQALRILMAAHRGDADAIKAMISVMEGATASADGASGLVPKPEAGDQDKVLKGDGTWGGIPSPNLGTASRAVQTDANGALATSSVTAVELGYLSGVTSAVQTQINAKATDSDAVHLAGTETIGGTKIFSSAIVASGSSAALRRPDKTSALTLLGGDNAQAASGAKAYFYGGSSSSQAGEYLLQAGNSSGYKQLIGKPDGTLTWDGNAIQTSSDERLKTPMEPVTDAVLDAWGSVQWGQFQFLDAVERKGGSARLHLGLIAQRVKAVFEARGMDACAFGILCHEKHDATEDRPAVDLWMVRYEEALAMEATFQRRRADKLEARIAALEGRLHG